MTLSLGDLLRTPTIFDLEPKPKAQIESEVDLLVIACARARLLDEGDHSIGFRQQELLKKMIPADLDQASLIREYYGKKLMLLQLKDKVELSSFRKALANFLTSDGKIYTEETIGLVYKLPRFYHYDKTVDLLREDHGLLNISEDNWHQFKYENSGATANFYSDYTGFLNPISILPRHTKRSSVYEFWFKENNGLALNLDIDMKNPLLPIWENIFNRGKPLNISGRVRYCNPSDFGYLKFENWKLVDFQ